MLVSDFSSVCRCVSVRVSKVSKCHSVRVTGTMFVQVDGTRSFDSKSVQWEIWRYVRIGEPREPRRRGNEWNLPKLLLTHSLTRWLTHYSFTHSLTTAVFFSVELRNYMSWNYAKRTSLCSYYYTYVYIEWRYCCNFFAILYHCSFVLFKKNLIFVFQWKNRAISRPFRRGNCQTSLLHSQKYRGRNSDGRHHRRYLASLVTHSDHPRPFFFFVIDSCSLPFHFLSCQIFLSVSLAQHSLYLTLTVVPHPLSQVVLLLTLANDLPSLPSAKSSMRLPQVSIATDDTTQNNPDKKMQKSNNYQHIRAKVKSKKKSRK